MRKVWSDNRPTKFQSFHTIGHPIASGQEKDVAKKGRCLFIVFNNEDTHSHPESLPKVHNEARGKGFPVSSQAGKNEG
jgi:hypothetical protein